MEKGVKIELTTDFGVIRETLSRMGIVNKAKRIITPTAYIYNENDEYYIVHFKELLTMADGSSDVLDEKDTDRRNSICSLLQNWGLIEIIDTGAYRQTLIEKIFVLTSKEKNEQEYTINHKFKSFAKLAETRS